MRPRDPRRLLARHREATARVEIIHLPQSEAEPGKAVTTKQAAEVTLPREELLKVWSPEFLERLARTYWRFLTRVSAGLIQVHYEDDARLIVLVSKPLVLLRFHEPEYRMGSDFGMVTWRIDRGILVAPTGRSNGYLRITVERPARDRGGDTITGTVTSEVANFYPTLGGWGWFARAGRHLYRVTQLRIHVVITHAFLRSLARLDLAESRVGSLRADAESTAEDDVPSASP